MEYLPIQGINGEYGQEIVLGYMTQRSLEENGYTYNFGRNTWYKMVERVAVLLEAAGETWDSTYGTIEETFLYPSGEEDELTARRFNAVAYNIEKILGNKWRWAVDETVEKGYLGRPRVYGVTEVGVKKADIVYGWYLLELVRAVNMFINIIYHGGYECLEELSLETISDSNVKALLDSLDSAPLFSYAGIDTKLKAELCIPETAEFKSEIISKSDVFSDAKLTEMIRMNTEYIYEKSLAHSEIIIPHILLMYTRSQNKSNTIVKMLLPKVVQAYSQVLCRTHKQSDLKIFQSVNVGNIALNSSLANAEVRKKNPLHITSEGISRSIAYLDLKVVRPKEIVSKSTVHSLVSTILDEVLSKALGSKVKEYSKANIELLKRQSFDCISYGTVTTKISASLSFWIPETEKEWYEPAQVGTNLYIRNAYPQWQEGSNVHLDGGIYYEPEQMGTNVYIRSAENLKGV